MKTFLINSAVCVAAFSVAACSGDMRAVSRNGGEEMKISYEQGLDRDFYTAVVGSETFKGAAFDAGAGSAYATNFSGDSFYMASSSGNFVSTLIGDKGSTMRCRMNYVDSSGMTNFGGNGVCEHSDGRIFDVVW